MMNEIKLIDEITAPPIPTMLHPSALFGESVIQTGIQDNCSMQRRKYNVKKMANMGFFLNFCSNMLIHIYMKRDHSIFYTLACTVNFYFTCIALKIKVKIRASNYHTFENHPLWGWT